MLITKGIVVDGNKIGKSIGFPTLNLSNWQINKDVDFGVYGCRILIQEVWHKGILHYGYKGIDRSKIFLEVHVFDFNEDVYGEDVTVEFDVFVRPPQVFSGIEDLKEQIIKDIDFVKASASTKAVIIFAKNPVLGKCKTRLARTIGDEGALAFYLDSCKYVANLMGSIDADVFIYFGGGLPNNENKAAFIWKNMPWRDQVVGNLGLKMYEAMNDLFKLGYKKVLLAGSDCPQMQVSDFVDAFIALDTVDVVWGPAVDGGYYLVGMDNERLKDKSFIFSNIEWSTDIVLRQSHQRCNDVGLSFVDVTMRNDVDYYEDLVDTVKKTGMFAKYLLD